tara:strand:+ start:363 stop:665 length:303 start_codon:yes stop_codon:yes gene_type:complete
MSEKNKNVDESSELDSIKNDVEEIKRILLKNRKDLEVSDISSLLSRLTQASENLSKWEETNKKNIEGLKRSVNDIGKKTSSFSILLVIIITLLVIIAVLQ